MNVLTVVSNRYNGHELWVALGVLESRNHSYRVVSTNVHMSDEVNGRKTLAHGLVSTATLEGFDALMFISGNMKDTEAYWTDPSALRLVSEAHEKDLPIAAICCSVPTIRSVVRGKRISFFPLLRSRERLVKQGGAIESGVSLCVDGKIVTAEHQMATQMWAEEFCNVLEGKPTQYSFKPSGFTPQGRERKPDPDIEKIKSIVAKKGTRLK